MKFNLKALAVLAALLIGWFSTDILFYFEDFKALYSTYPFYIPGILRSLIEIAFVLLATFVIFRPSLSTLAEMLGLKSSFQKGLVFGIYCVVPLYLVFAFAFTANTNLNLGEVGYLSFISPFAEEFLYRAFAFGLLLRLGFNFWAAALIPAVLFGFGHLSADMELGETVGVLTITGIGSLFFSWVYMKWDNNLWTVVFLHSLMNLAWNIFNVGDSAFAGWLPTTMQITTLAMAVLLTWKKNQIPGLK